MSSGSPAGLSPGIMRTVALLGALTASCAMGQQANNMLPDAPGALPYSSSLDPTGAQNQTQTSPAKPTPVEATPGGPTNIPPPSGEGVQSKRIFGIIPNFRAVNADVKLPPQTVKEKFITASEDSFDYSSVVLPAAVAFYSYERNATPEFGTGGVGYARYLWHSAADQTIENYMVEFIGPVLTREDTRYYTLGRGTFLKRAGYSLTRIVITRSDSAKETFNISEVAGAAAGAGISQLYYPHQERTFGQFGSQWGTSLGIDAASFLFREFWPDINHLVFRQRGQ